MRILTMARVCFLNVLDGHGVDDHGGGVSGGQDINHDIMVWHHTRYS